MSVLTILASNYLFGLTRESEKQHFLLPCHQTDPNMLS